MTDLPGQKPARESVPKNGNGKANGTERRLAAVEKWISDRNLEAAEKKGRALEKADARKARKSLWDNVRLWIVLGLGLAAFVKSFLFT